MRCYNWSGSGWIRTVLLDKEYQEQWTKTSTAAILIICANRYALEETHMFVPFALVSGIGPHLVAILPPLRRYITSAPSPILIRPSPIMLTVHETMAFNASRSC